MSGKECKPADIKPEQNLLLAAFPDVCKVRLFPHLKLVSCGDGERLQEPGELVTFTTFPVTTMFALSYLLKDGSSTNLSLIGHEGMTGAHILMGYSNAFTVATVAIPGFCYKLPAGILYEEFTENLQLRALILKYGMSLVLQFAQAAACNRHHNLKQRMSRFLLQTRDRIQNDYLQITQETMATILGVRRESISETARALKLAGAIDYTRGELHIVSPQALRQMACECYQAPGDARES